MKASMSSLKRTLVIVVASVQFCVGALLLAGTIGITLTAFQTVRNESAQLAENLTAFAEALDASCEAYRLSASSMFELTDAMDDVAVKLGGVKGTIFDVATGFVNYGRTESSWYGKVVPFTEWFKSSGEKLREVGRDVRSVSVALSGQSEAIKTYRDDGHDKMLDAITKTAESLRHAMRMLDNGSSAARWCGFVCLLGFCVSMLFFTNGALLYVLVRPKV